MKKYSQWRGAISYCRKLTSEAVICLFADGWRASATGGHTHTEDFLHFRRGELRGDKLPLAEEYFDLLRKVEAEAIPEWENENFGKAQEVLREIKEE